MLLMNDSKLLTLQNGIEAYDFFWFMEFNAKYHALNCIIKIK